LNKRGAVYYAAPDDRENLRRGVYLVALRGISPKDHPRNRQRALDQVLTQLDQGDFPDQCFSNGLGVKDLIFISPLSSNFSNSKDDAMSQSDTPSLSLEEQEIIIAANELIELARLKVELAKSFRSAQQYKDLVLKIVAPDSGHLSESECQIVMDKAFAKTIKTLAESRVKVTQWHETASGRQNLILNEITFMDEEISHTLNLSKTIEEKESVDLATPEEAKHEA
jgi:hypothetical protein